MTRGAFGAVASVTFVCTAIFLRLFKRTMRKSRDSCLGFLQTFSYEQVGGVAAEPVMVEPATQPGVSIVEPNVMTADQPVVGWYVR